MTFDDFKLNRQLLNAVAEAGYEQPTPIQVQAIPLAMAGHDVLGIAQTGTGKTAAYLLPVLMKTKFAQGQHPRVLILAPTRELVMQIDAAIAELGKYTDIRHLALYGGIGPKTQIEAVQKGVDILVATPGRFMDIYLRGEIGVKQLNTMVMDEADKMMDMGFMPQIRKILEVIPVKRQNMLFSATFPAKVEELSYEFLEFPMRVEVTPQASTADMVTQKLYAVPNFKTKINLLAHLLSDEAASRVIVFARSKETADNIYKFLARKVVADDRIRVLHANKGQNTRINSMEAFKEGNIRVLVTTDVTARGIDVNEVSHVINFDVPLIYEDYVHRIGRTGRANRSGEAVTFMTIAEEYHVAKIEKIIRMPIPRESIPAAVEIPETPFDEQQAYLREIDNQRKKEDPTFKGAFHDKKGVPTKGRPTPPRGKSPQNPKAPSAKFKPGSPRRRKT
ncbi:DEAD/DEAH box helicase [Larkinella sp. VNQ87]|uniref:DEAD/DEAH box helicase n=1 Tax=Larkinella sp. VNQ87 TaxID=3400921 RepID=UPI003C0D4652